MLLVTMTFFSPGANSFSFLLVKPYSASSWNTVSQRLTLPTTWVRCLNTVFIKIFYKVKKTALKFISFVIKVIYIHCGKPRIIVFYLSKKNHYRHLGSYLFSLCTNLKKVLLILHVLAYFPLSIIKI